MKVTPEKSTVITSHWLKLPTGMAIAWTDSIPFELLSRIIAASDDFEYADREKTLVLKKLSL